MSSIKIVGKAIVLTSKLKTETIKQLKKFAPTALTVINDKGEPVFAVGYSAKGNASINKNGVEYNGTSPEGMAQATFMCADDVAAEKQKQYVLDTYGAGLMQLDAVEDQILSAANTLNDKITAISDGITVG